MPIVIDGNATQIILAFFNLLGLVVGAVAGYFKFKELRFGQEDLKNNQAVLKEHVDGKMQQLLDTKDRESIAKQEAAGSAGELRGRDQFNTIAPTLLPATVLAGTIIESAEDAIISKNLDGTITSWNRGAERIFGYTASEMIGQSITVLFPPDKVQEEDLILEKLRRGEKVDHFETARLRKDGSLVNLSLTISPIKDHFGRIIGASKVARQITTPTLIAKEIAAEVIPVITNKIDEASEKLGNKASDELARVLGKKEI